MLRDISTELAWVRECYASYNAGIPEPALDSTGFSLSLLIVALEVIQSSPDATIALEKRLNDGEGN